MSEPYDPEVGHAEYRELVWREGIVQRELDAALRDWFRLLCPEENPDDHAAWLHILSERTVACLTSFYGGNHPWYDFDAAPEALKLALYGRSELCIPEVGWRFRRVTIEHEPSCAGMGSEAPQGPDVMNDCRCHLRVRRDE